MNDPAPADYVTTVLNLYVQLPDTPLRANPQDRMLARQLQDRGVALPVIEAAFLLASARRLARPTDVPPLSPIRSLAYFQPVIEEILSNPLPNGYVEYLRLKLQQLREMREQRLSQAHKQDAATIISNR
jgi:hypothetical protein